MRRQPFLALMAAALAAGTLFPDRSQASDWSRFRGPQGAGIALGDDFPVELDEGKARRWKVECGAGTSSPVVFDNRVFLTAFNAEERQIKCFDATRGTALWEQSLRAARKEVATAPGGPVNPTPAVDAASVYAFFPDIGVVCCSHDGQRRWQVDLGPFQSFHGITASLVVADGKLFVLADQLQDSFLVALDCRTGAEAWKVARQDGPIGGYSTPVVRVTADGSRELVVSGPMEVVGYELASGKRRWSIGGATNAPISVPVIGGDQVFVCEPSFSQNPFKIDSLLVHDKNKDGELSLEELGSQVPLQRIARLIDKSWGNGDGKINAAELEKAFESFVGGGGLVAIQLAGPPEMPTARVNWIYRKNVPQIPSLLFYDDVLFIINDGGILTSMNPANGEILKRARLNHGSTFYASPVAAAGKMMLVDTEGKISVVTASAQWSVVATSELGQRCYATPAIAGGCVFIRGERELFCFGNAD